MKGPGLLALFTDLLSGGSGETNVLAPDGINGDGSLRIERSSRAAAARELLGD
jgi:hypothetical protein